MPTKRNFLVKVLDAKIVDVKRALEAKSIKIESIYEMYKENQEPDKVASPAPSNSAPEKTKSPELSVKISTTQPSSTEKDSGTPPSESGSSAAPTKTS